MNKKGLLPFLYFILNFILISWSVYAQELPIANSIEIKGLKRVEDSAVKSKVTQKVGEPISMDKTSEDIKNIFKMGYFDDVRAEIEPLEGGIRLIYIVKEKPAIVRIEFQGNKEFDDPKLKEKIKRINAEGNKGISTRRIKKAMDTKEWWFFSFITSAGYYKKERMESDIEKIRDLYFNNGFIKVAVGEPKIQLTDIKKGMIITIPVSEGDQFKISSIEFSGNEVFDNDEIKKRITMRPNNPFSKANLKKTILSISELYSENGYALVAITPDVIPDERKKLAKIILKIDEGDRYKIGRIEISGNTKTRDKVIRREVRYDEGDIFN